MSVIASNILSIKSFQDKLKKNGETPKQDIMPCKKYKNVPNNCKYTDVDLLITVPSIYEISIINFIMKVFKIFILIFFRSES